MTPAKATPTPALIADELATALTKREHFAAMAMQGMLANPAVEAKPKRLADLAWQMADAMLAPADIPATTTEAKS